MYLQKLYTERQYGGEDATLLGNNMMEMRKTTTAVEP
jgi:hypothetical protein